MDGTPKRVVVAIGSNHHASEAIVKGLKLTQELLTDTTASSVIETAPIGIPSPPFLNCLVVGYTLMTSDELVGAFKRIERQCGDRPSLRRQHRITLDIDLLEYDGTRYHQADWERAYIQVLLQEVYSYQQSSVDPPAANLSSSDQPFIDTMLADTSPADKPISPK